MVAALFGWGAWQRRWIADDGLIVLRTVRNLLAGNGPVFNVGERVEANTSTFWTYLIYLGGWIGGPVRLEYVALVLALVLSVAGVALLMLGAGRLYAPGLRGRRALLLPAGALVYIAVPPARDFATSGLENSLVHGLFGPAVVDDGLLVDRPCAPIPSRSSSHRRRGVAHRRPYAGPPSPPLCRRCPPPTSSADSLMLHWHSSQV